MTETSGAPELAPGAPRDDLPGVWRPDRARRASGHSPRTGALTCATRAPAELRPTAPGHERQQAP